MRCLAGSVEPSPGFSLGIPGCVLSPALAILSPMPPASGLSPNLQHLETSATIAISQEAKRRKAAGEDVIDLGAGEPDFPTPPIPADAGVRAIREGKTHYPANEGILELRAGRPPPSTPTPGGPPEKAAHPAISNGAHKSPPSGSVSGCRPAR